MLLQMNPIGQVKEWSDFRGASTFDRGVTYFLDKVGEDRRTLGCSHGEGKGNSTESRRMMITWRCRPPVAAPWGGCVTDPWMVWRWLRCYV